jgi:glycosyltransferase involved in cell wall biosynthesis
MDYAPNVDAVQYFADEIFPKIQAQFPEVIFEIAGGRPIPAVLALNSRSGIRVTGFIPNLADAYASATIVVAPLRFGAGTQNKVLEALSMDIPVVCTPIGFHGIGLGQGEGIWCERSTDDIIERILKLLAEPEKHKLMASDGGKSIRQRFNWQTISQQLINYFQDIQTAR